MKFLPYENYNLTTDLTAEEVSHRLSLNIEPPKINLFNSKRKSLYEGYITEGKFEITRIIRLRNPWLPEISGEISTNEERKTVVHIVMIVGSLGLGASILWFGAVFFVWYMSIRDMIKERQFDPKFLVLILFTLFAYSLMLLAFKFESRKSKKFFEKIVEPDYSGQISN